MQLKIRVPSTEVNLCTPHPLLIPKLGRAKAFWKQKAFWMERQNVPLHSHVSCRYDHCQGSALEVRPGQVPAPAHNPTVPKTFYRELLTPQACGTPPADKHQAAVLCGSKETEIRGPATQTLGSSWWPPLSIYTELPRGHPMPD